MPLVQEEEHAGGSVRPQESALVLNKIDQVANSDQEGKVGKVSIVFQ
jgi:hypothetical protein